MSIELETPGTIATSVPESDRDLLVVWQHPQTREFISIGQLSRRRAGYSFSYLPGAHHPDFQPLPNFPRLDESYQTRELPAFFRNRVMSSGRSSFDRYVDWLGIDPSDDVPFEILARTGGERATDTFHIVERPRVDESGVARIRFFASGLRHQEHSAALLERLVPGDRLFIRPEPENPVDPQAIIIEHHSKHALGWVPRWLLPDVHAWRALFDLTLYADVINVDAPWHLKLLCRFEGRALQAHSQ